jgi:hypothetical protein
VTDVACHPFDLNGWLRPVLVCSPEGRLELQSFAEVSDVFVISTAILAMAFETASHRFEEHARVYEGASSVQAPVESSPEGASESESAPPDDDDDDVDLEFDAAVNTTGAAEPDVEETDLVEADATAEPDQNAEAGPNEKVENMIASMREEMQSLRVELDELKAERTVAESEAEPDPEKRSSPTRDMSPVKATHSLDEHGHAVGKGFFISSYIQSQFESSQASENQLFPGGQLANQDRFVVRRGRVKLTGDWQYAGGIIELDGNTTFGGFGVVVRRAEGYLQYRRNRTDLPLVQGAVGVIDALFGYELNVSSRARPFMERSLIIRSIWPSPADVGARIQGAYKTLRYAVQALNGQPWGAFDGHPGLAPTRSKDFVGKLGADVPIGKKERFRIAGNVSALRGHGFHPGSDAIKPGVGWSDQNEDGAIQPTELTPDPARAATPSQTFPRWAMGADLQLHLETKLGHTQVYGEFILAQNMDRALYVSDPIITGQDQRMFGWYVAGVQEITPYSIVGFRYDYYDPNSDVFDQRGGRILPFNQRIQTFSPLVGLQLPRRARLMFQYDIIDDFFGRDSRGVPTNLKNNAWTIRLQVQL